LIKLITAKSLDINLGLQLLYLSNGKFIHY